MAQGAVFPSAAGRHLEPTNERTSIPLLVALPSSSSPSCCCLAAVLLKLMETRGSEVAQVAGLGFDLIVWLCGGYGYGCDHWEHNRRLLRGAEGFHRGKQRGKHFSALLAHTLPPSLCTHTRVCCAALKHTVVSLPCSKPGKHGSNGHLKGNVRC